MLEAGVLLNRDGDALYWHLPAGRSAGALPDSASLWAIMWEHRDELLGFAHSHPGHGVPRPSHTDVTTFAAIEAALGRRLRWPIINWDMVVEVCWVGPGRLDYATVPHRAEPSWAGALRAVSGLVCSDRNVGSKTHFNKEIRHAEQL